jgi:hypothetical protein
MRGFPESIMVDAFSSRTSTSTTPGKSGSISARLQPKKDRMLLAHRVELAHQKCGIIRANTASNDAVEGQRSRTGRVVQRADVIYAHVSAAEGVA